MVSVAMEHKGVAQVAPRRVLAVPSKVGRPLRASERAFQCHSSAYEIRVCTNKTCKTQGSRQILQFGTDLSHPLVRVEPCGCLGSCGKGPNVVIIPLETGPTENSPKIIHYQSSPARFVDMLHTFCNVTVDQMFLKSTELRLAGNAEAMDGNYENAIKLYSQGLEMAGTGPSRHLLLANRSGARLASKDVCGAIEDAALAVEVSPPEFTTAAVRLADALFASGQYDQALCALQAGAERCQGWRKTGEYKSLERHINHALKQALAKR